MSYLDCWGWALWLYWLMVGRSLPYDSLKYWDGGEREERQTPSGLSLVIGSQPASQWFNYSRTACLLLTAEYHWLASPGPPFLIRSVVRAGQSWKCWRYFLKSPLECRTESRWVRFVEVNATLSTGWRRWTWYTLTDLAGPEHRDEAASYKVQDWQRLKTPTLPYLPPLVSLGIRAGRLDYVYVGHLRSDWAVSRYKVYNIHKSVLTISNITAVYNKYIKMNRLESLIFYIKQFKRKTAL